MTRVSTGLLPSGVGAPAAADHGDEQGAGDGDGGGDEVPGITEELLEQHQIRCLR